MIKKIKDIGVVAAITTKDPEKAIDYVSACVRGGIHGVEINYATPKISYVVKKVKELYPNILIGVAEIPDTFIAQELIEIGVNYITTPYSDDYIDMVCDNIDDLIYIPGCMTLSEVNAARKKGNNTIKLYPAEMLNPKYISIINSTIKYVNVIPSGGINIENIKDWYDHGAKCVVVGKYLLEVDNLDEIEERAKKLMDVFNGGR